VKKGQFSKVVVVTVLMLNILFTISVLVVFWHTSTEPSSLIASWFAFTTSELGLTAFVKGKKIKKGENNGDENNSEYSNRFGNSN